MSTAEACVLGAAPNAVDAPENILLFVSELRVGLDAHDDLPGHRGYLACGRSSWQAPPRSTSTGSR